MGGFRIVLAAIFLTIDLFWASLQADGDWAELFLGPERARALRA